MPMPEFAKNPPVIPLAQALSQKLHFKLVLLRLVPAQRWIFMARLNPSAFAELPTHDFAVCWWLQKFRDFLVLT